MNRFQKLKEPNIFCSWKSLTVELIRCVDMRKALLVMDIKGIIHARNLVLSRGYAAERNMGHDAGTMSHSKNDCLELRGQLDSELGIISYQ